MYAIARSYDSMLFMILAMPRTSAIGGSSG